MSQGTTWHAPATKSLWGQELGRVGIQYHLGVAVLQ